MRATVSAAPTLLTDHPGRARAIAANQRRDWTGRRRSQLSRRRAPGSRQCHEAPCRFFSCKLSFFDRFMPAQSPLAPPVPFDFRPRTNVTFGQGSLERLSVLARELGFNRTLLVADPGLVNAGHVEPAANLLRAAGIDVIRFSDFDANPDTDMIET